MTARIQFHPSARDELRAAAVWYERSRAGLGTEFHDEVQQVIDRLASRLVPGMSVQTPGNQLLEKVFLRRFPYAIYFQFRGESCVIWAIAHGSRRPFYWQNRL